MRPRCELCPSMTQGPTPWWVPGLAVLWCPRQDSNLRPSAPEADALSTELRGRVAAYQNTSLNGQVVHLRWRMCRVSQCSGRCSWPFRSLPGTGLRG